MKKKDPTILLNHMLASILAGVTQFIPLLKGRIQEILQEYWTVL